jgi:heme-degrading monooxygenase HmoA
MIAVLFESKPYPGQKDAYLAAGARLAPFAETFDGFIGIERFESITNPGKVMAISYWRDEESVERWRNLDLHRKIQSTSRKTIFADYRLRVAKVIRDYTMNDRAQAPEDSRVAHGA